jgi:amidase
VALAFRAAGLIPLGRTNTPELAVMGTTEPAAFGPTRNPWDGSRSPGGSSGGSAAAVATGCVAAAHANDIAGSIRIPAAHCGLVGLKPTRGRTIANTGVAPPVGMHVEGVITRTVRDTAALLDVVAAAPGPAWWSPPALPGRLIDELAHDQGTRPGRSARLRVGLCIEAFNGVTVEDECAAAATEATRLLERLGHHVEEGTPDGLHGDELQAAMKTAIAATADAELRQWSARLGRELGEADVESATWAVIAAARATTAAGLVDALTVIEYRSRRAAAWWGDGGFDLLVTPTTAEGPSMLGRVGYQQGRASAFTRIFNATGQPALSLPLGWPSDGLPRGVQIVAAHGREDLLIRVGRALEEAAPWAHRTPTVPISSNATVSVSSGADGPAGPDDGLR